MVKVELEKILTNIAFYLCIVAVVILLLAGTVYKDPSSGEEYNLIQLMISNSDEIIKEADLHGTDVIVAGVGGYLDMFLPIIVAVPFIIVVRGEKKNSNARFEIYRIGKNRYLFGKFFASIISGGLVLMIGYLLFSVITFFALPGKVSILMELKYDYFRKENGFYKWYYDTFHVAGMMVLKQIRMFLYGAATAVPAFGLSMIIKNRYVIISIPFMFFYLLEKFVTKMENPEFYRLLINNIGNVFDYRILSMFAIFGGATILILVLCRIYLGRKCDCGEN